MLLPWLISTQLRPGAALRGGGVEPPRPEDTGNAKIAVKGKEVALPTLPLGQDPEVVIQLSNSDGQCWESRFTTARKNDAAKFTAK